MTLTLGISKQTLRMTLALVVENKCLKFFWNPFTNVEVMLLTRMGHKHRSTNALTHRRTQVTLIPPPPPPISWQWHKNSYWLPMFPSIPTMFSKGVSLEDPYFQLGIVWRRIHPTTPSRLEPFQTERVCRWPFYMVESYPNTYMP